MTSLYVYWAVLLFAVGIQAFNPLFSSESSSSSVDESDWNLINMWHNNRNHRSRDWSIDYKGSISESSRDWSSSDSSSRGWNRLRSTRPRHISRNWRSTDSSMGWSSSDLSKLWDKLHFMRSNSGSRNWHHTHSSEDWSGSDSSSSSTSKWSESGTSEDSSASNDISEWSFKNGRHNLVINNKMDSSDSS